MKRWDRDFERKKADREARRQKNLERYHSEQEQALPTLLECRSILDHQVQEVERFSSG